MATKLQVDFVDSTLHNSEDIVKELDHAIQRSRQAIVQAITSINMSIRSQTQHAIHIHVNVTSPLHYGFGQQILGMEISPVIWHVYTSLSLLNWSVEAHTIMMTWCQPSASICVINLQGPLIHIKNKHQIKRKVKEQWKLHGLDISQCVYLESSKHK